MVLFSGPFQPRTFGAPGGNSKPVTETNNNPPPVAPNPPPVSNPPPKEPNAEDQKKLNQVEAGGSVANAPKVSVIKEFRSDPQWSAKLRALQYASGPKREKLLAEIQTAWIGKSTDFTKEQLFGGSVGDFLEQKINKGTATERVQAGLWALSRDFGTQLGPFGTAGIDGKKGAFTQTAIDRFKIQYRPALENFRKEHPEIKTENQAAESLIVQLAQRKLDNEKNGLSVQGIADFKMVAGDPENQKNIGFLNSSVKAMRAAKTEEAFHTARRNALAAAQLLGIGHPTINILEGAKFGSLPAKLPGEDLVVATNPTLERKLPEQKTAA